jgi:hypothetical protein
MVQEAVEEERKPLFVKQERKTLLLRRNGENKRRSLVLFQND